LGYRIWPAIAVGAFVANLTTPTPALTSLGIAAGNTLEALLGAYLLNRLVGIQPSLKRFRDLFGLIFFGAIVGTTASATVGVISLCLTGLQSWGRFGPLLGNWFLGDAMGDVIVAPFILTVYAHESRRRIAKRGLVEFIILLVVLIAISAYVFNRESPLPNYAIFPVLIWAALRFGTCGMATAGLMTATIAVMGTIRGYGPFSVGSTNENLIALELFLLVAVVTGLIMAIAETQRAEAEQSSHRSEDRYRSLVLASSQVVWSTDANGKVVEDLPTWRAFTGQTKEELLSGNWDRKVHPDDRAHVHEVLGRSIATGTPNQDEFRLCASDGTYRNMLSRAIPVLERDGRVREWVGTMIDITEQKRAVQEMQLANQRKDEFLAMLAHELRNPLAPIRNAVELLRLKGPSDPQFQAQREVIHRQLQQLTRLVDDLLDVSRITQGKITLRKEKVELVNILARAVETSRPLIEARHQQFTVTMPPDSLRVEGDGTRLAQVVSNLLNNAAKYTEKGGHIWLNAGLEGEQIVIRVKDTGVGIPTEVLPRVFDLFTQADRSLDRSEGGLGIGLTLVRSLIEMHGGRVEAFSAGPGHGSEFIIHLPALPVELRTSAKSTRSIDMNTSSAPLRILVVDDNQDSAETLALLLTFSGHDVRVAHEGDTALETAGAFLPQVIILDIGLPRMDGYEVARRLRMRPQSKNCFLIALTGYGQDEDRQRSKEAGFDHHMVKPVDPVELQSLIQDVTKERATDLLPN
jgi:PAS domain S-box-containing protein